MSLSFTSLRPNPRLTLVQKVWNISWGLVLLILLLAVIGGGMLYSAANGGFDPWPRARRCVSVAPSC